MSNVIKVNFGRPKQVETPASPVPVVEEAPRLQEQSAPTSEVPQGNQGVTINEIVSAFFFYAGEPTRGKLPGWDDGKRAANMLKRFGVEIT